ncbi:MAG TPA: hypothetical protein VGH80_14595 [Xanthomonadaceae bacterium]|jgi:hypothetical protein
MRRLMLALSIASCTITPAVFAHSHHMGSSHHAGMHRAHSRSNDGDSQANAGDSAFDPSDRSRTVADVGRGRHHAQRVPDEEELAQPEQ